MGVTLEQDLKTRLLYMKQTGLIKRVIDSVVLDDGTSKGKLTPSEGTPLDKDENGEPASEMFRYSRVVGMLLYLSGHNILDVALAPNCCVWIMFSPKRSH